MSTPRNTRPSTSPARRAARLACVAATLVAGALAAACADAPSAPLQAGAAALPSLGKAGAAKAGRFGESDTLEAPRVSRGVLRTTPLPAPVRGTFQMTRSGGHYTLPGTGLSIHVPAGAVPDQPITITVTAPAGDLVAYEFEPHGTRFKKPLEMTQDLRGTSWSQLGVPLLEVGYFASHADLDSRGKSAKVSEILPVGLDAVGKHLDFDVVHFSGYMVSWGRS